MATPSPWTGGGPPHGPPSLPHQKPQAAITSAQAGDRGPVVTPYTRTFSQIIAEEKSQRNILEIHLRKIPVIQNQVPTKPKNLTFDDIGDFLFDVLKLNPDDCLKFDFTTGRLN